MGMLIFVSVMEPKDRNIVRLITKMQFGRKGMVPTIFYTISTTEHIQEHRELCDEELCKVVSHIKQEKFSQD
jgi:hypothetical protein